MTQLIISEGTTLAVVALAADATAPTDATTYAELESTLKTVDFLSDLPTFDPTRPESRTPTLDKGEIVGAGTTTRATGTFTVLASKGASEGYDAIKAAFGAGSTVVPKTLICKVTFTDTSIKFFQAHVTAAQESAPVGNNKQMSVTLAVQGEVVDVDAA